MSTMRARTMGYGSKAIRIGRHAFDGTTSPTSVTVNDRSVQFISRDNDLTMMFEALNWHRNNAPINERYPEAEILHGPECFVIVKTKLDADVLTSTVDGHRMPYYRLNETETAQPAQLTFAERLRQHNANF